MYKENSLKNDRSVFELCQRIIIRMYEML